MGTYMNGDYYFSWPDLPADAHTDSYFDPDAFSQWEPCGFTTEGGIFHVSQITNHDVLENIRNILRALPW